MNRMSVERPRFLRDVPGAASETGMGVHLSVAYEE